MRFAPAVLLAMLTCLSTHPAQAVHLELESAVAGDATTVDLAMLLHAHEASVGGLQSDLYFDHRILQLQDSKDCVVSPQLATKLPACEDDPPSGPCKDLLTNLVDCGVAPQGPGCENVSPTTSRLRWIVAAVSVPNNNPIPDGSILFRCTFTVVDAARLPASIQQDHVFGSDPFGTRLTTTANHGAILRNTAQNPPHTWTPLRSPTPASTPTATRASDHTPTPAFVHSPTRTPAASRTPTPSPTRHFTFPPPRPPLPRGFPCEDASYCTSRFCVDLTCCDEATCPTDQFCNISAHEGSCAARKPIMQACNADTDCLTLNCSIGAPDTPRGFAGLCAPTRTPTPTGGDPPCSADEHCQPGFFCNEREGFLCCDAKQCPLGQTCRDPRNPGFCTTLPTPTATPPPNPEACSESNPAACATGFCVDSNCCSTASCPSNQRCDIHGYEGNCVRRLWEGAPCAKHSDCANGLQCRDLDGNGTQCILPHQHATPVATLASTRIPAAAPADGGCAIGKQAAPMGAAVLLLGAGLLLLRSRSQRLQD